MPPSYQLKILTGIVKSEPHPPYSPDFAPPDFYLFWYVKRCLACLSFDDADQLLGAVEGVLYKFTNSAKSSRLFSSSPPSSFRSFS
jgi:hypothetical protein